MDSATFMIADLGGAIETTVGRFPFYERYVDLYPDGVRSTTGLPFGRRTLVAAGGGRIHLTMSDGFEVQIYGMDGRLERILRIVREPRPGTAADIERYDPDGRWLGTVEGPEGFRTHQIGSDYIRGVHRLKDHCVAGAPGCIKMG